MEEKASSLFRVKSWLMGVSKNSDPRPEKLRPAGVSKTQTPKKLRPSGVSKTQTRKTQTLGCLDEKTQTLGCLENSDPKNKTYLHRVNAASRLVYCSLIQWYYHNLPRKEKQFIHRMQIWRTTRSSPGTSRMKARLAGLRCFGLTMLFQKSLASLSIWSLCFVLPTRFCVPECHRNRVESSTAEKVFFFSVFSFASEGKPKRRRQGVHIRRRAGTAGWNRS